MTVGSPPLYFSGGVARVVLVLFALLLWADDAVLAVNFPALTGRIVDQANIIPAETRSAIEPKLADLESQALGVEFVGQQPRFDYWSAREYQKPLPAECLGRHQSRRVPAPKPTSK